MVDEKFTLEQIRQHPNTLAKYYKKFKVDKEYLFTGHSHQAWPDCSFEAQAQSWIDAAEFKDEKWEKALKKSEDVQKGFASLLDDDRGYITLASNTHDLLIKFLSGLDFSKGRRIITTDSEFHTVRRQLNALNERAYINLVTITGHPANDVIVKIINEINDETLCVIISAVYFSSGQIVDGFSELMEACEIFGVKLLIDVYHVLNVIPFSIKELKLDQAYIIGGGYKYCQLGEGNAFLRFPKDCEMRPFITGWFSEWSHLSNNSLTKTTKYDSGSSLFAGSTYDPTSHYRASSVFNFFREKNLNPNFLRIISQHQINLLAQNFDQIDVDPSIITRDRNIPCEKIAGFLVLNSSKAREINEALKTHGVYTDYRNNNLRIGPAPYISDLQIVDAMKILKEVIIKL